MRRPTPPDRSRHSSGDRLRWLACAFLALPSMVGCKGDNAPATADTCDAAGTCLAAPQADATLILANVGENFGFVTPDHRATYGQTGCTGHFVLDLARRAEDGNVAVNVTWDPVLPTTPCAYQMDLQLYGNDGSGWTFLAESRQKSGDSSGVCIADQTFRCGAGQDILTGPGVAVTDPRYVTVRAAISVVDQNGGQVSFQVLGQKWH